MYFATVSAYLRFDREACLTQAIDDGVDQVVVFDKAAYEKATRGGKIRPQIEASIFS